MPKKDHSTKKSVVSSESKPKPGSHGKSTQVPRENLETKTAITMKKSLVPAKKVDKTSFPHGDIHTNDQKPINSTVKNMGPEKPTSIIPDAPLVATSLWDTKKLHDVPFMPILSSCTKWDIAKAQTNRKRKMSDTHSLFTVTPLNADINTQPKQDETVVSWNEDIESKRIKLGQVIQREQSLLERRDRCMTKLLSRPEEGT